MSVQPAFFEPEQRFRRSADTPDRHPISRTHNPTTDGDLYRDGRRTELLDELKCLHGVLPVAVLRSAERRSRALNIGADQVLIHDGSITEIAYIRNLARHLGISVDDLSDASRGHCPLATDDLPQVAQSGILPLRRGETFAWVIAPRAFTARQLTRFAGTYSELLGKVRLTTRHHLHQFLTQQAGDILSEIAAGQLRQQRPVMSASAPATTPPRAWRARLIVLTCLLAAAWQPLLALDVVGALAAVWFLAFSLLRLICALIPQQVTSCSPRLRDDELPVYSIIIALYREATSVPGLLRSLQRLDYPPEKLDIILVLEMDDLQTRAAIARARPGPQIQVLIAQATGPKTKPKALNVALPFARGSFVAVYDAEDDPDPQQLRAALDMFHHHDETVACVQAGLHFDNLNHSLLSRMSAVEYAGLFAVFLPGLVALGMPLPLGGTSNHFRTSSLRRVGGWDAYNVTEDADLGIRLTRLGYRCVTVDSITLEEAPIAFGGWLKQRSRWMKGWMQTWGVHMRNPVQLWRDAGTRGFLAFNIIFGGNILTSLAFAILFAKLAVCSALGDFAGLTGDSLAPLHLVALGFGFAATCAIGLTGLARRGRLRDGWVLALTPVYWACLSIACWRALWQYWTKPYHWEKTEHGLVHRAGSITQGAAPAGGARAQR
jgi:cellulose synthase/poly-beta-1,6-N-acetylglucosamine synthase-like glycosyltransferase